MGTPIKGKTYSMAPTPEGEEHPNIMVTDLRKAAEMALKFCETLGENHWGDRKAVVYTLRAALAQPEQEPEPWMGVSDNPYASDAGCNEPNGRAMRWHNKLQFMQPEPIPGATPMAEYAAKSAAVPGRAEALKQAGYTRRPRQLPKEDEQEPVAWWDGKESVVFTHDEIYTPNWTDYWTQSLYTAPPQRQPLTDEEIGKATAHIAAMHCAIVDEIARAIEKAHGIGGEE